VAAIRLIGRARREDRPVPDAETLLKRALELAPGFTAARANLAMVLYKQNRTADAVAELDRVLESDTNPANVNLMAVALCKIGDYEESLRLYEELAPAFPDHPKLWMSYGPHPQDRRQAGRKRRRLSPCAGGQAGPRRGVVEPRQPQDRAVRGQ
jgi:tetratricopeptide (TPR) repeat protein